MRADQLLLEKGLAKSRTQSQKLIRSGKVFFRQVRSWQPVLKASQDLSEDSEIRVEPSEEQRFVSRAGLKLSAALEHLSYTVVDKVALDIGQSTGGFSDCLVQAGAQQVIGVDVGHNQLDLSLRANPRIICIEGVNARNLSPKVLLPWRDPPCVDLIVMDVSFISQTLILPVLTPLLAEGGVLISLVKPQFEVGPAGLAKGGLVKNTALYPRVEEKICQEAEKWGLRVHNYFESAVQGGDGNREFFLYAS